MLYVRSPSGTLFHLFFFQFHPFSIKFLHCCREVGKCKRENIKKTWGYVQLRCSWVHSVFPLVPVTVPWLTLTFLSSTTYSPRMSRVSDSNKSQFTSVMGYVPMCKAESYTVHASKWLWVISTSVSSGYNMEWLPPHSLVGLPLPPLVQLYVTLVHTLPSQKSHSSFLRQPFHWGHTSSMFLCISSSFSWIGSFIYFFNYFPSRKNVLQSFHNFSFPSRYPLESSAPLIICKH